MRDQTHDTEVGRRNERQHQLGEGEYGFIGHAGV